LINLQPCVLIRQFTGEKGSNYHFFGAHDAYLFIYVQI
jgi:hypothetical protein